jgi:putative flippase GtrA
LTLALVGLGATALYALLALIGAALTAMPAAAVSLLAYALAGAASYLAHRRLTFAVTGAHGDAPARFAALSLAGYGLAFALPALLTDLLGYPAWLPILATCVLVPLINALALSRLVFRKPLFSS